MPEDESDDWFDSDKLQDMIDATSRERRANPVQCVAEFLQQTWEDNTEEEGWVILESKARLSPWYVEDILACLDAVLADPPPNLVEVVRDQGSLYLYHDDGSARPYDYEETRAWLGQVARKLRAIHEAAQQEETEDSGESEA